jgi:hypothetical protein
MDSKPIITNNDSGAKSNTGNLIKCLCVLKFDDELGQCLERIYPEDSIDSNTIKQITSLGFPETNSITHGEIEYLFKVRESKKFY